MKKNIQDGLIISVWGFSDSIPKLLVKIAELISNYEPSESGFNAMRELLVQPMVIFFDKLHNTFSYYVILHFLEGHKNLC